MTRIHTHWLRVIHKWIGLIIGVQFLLWTLSGTMMALLPMDEVAGGAPIEIVPVPTPEADQWPAVAGQLGTASVVGLSLRPLLGRPVFEITTRDGTRIFDAATGRPVTFDAKLAGAIAQSSYKDGGAVKSVSSVDEITLAVRGYELPIWRVDFADEANTSVYISGSTGELLERRNDTWRLWDFFWMLHIMDYGQRTSFNHPLIWMFALGAVWLAITGIWLLIRTGWRSDFKRIRPGRKASPKMP